MNLLLGIVAWAVIESAQTSIKNKYNCKLNSLRKQSKSEASTTATTMPNCTKNNTINTNGNTRTKRGRERQRRRNHRDRSQFRAIKLGTYYVRYVEKGRERRWLRGRGVARAEGGSAGNWGTASQMFWYQKWNKTKAQAAAHIHSTLLNYTFDIRTHAQHTPHRHTHTYEHFYSYSQAHSQSKSKRQISNRKTQNSNPKASQAWGLWRDTAA